jgi:bifunctional non-homologous end joining protein LigD
MAATGKKINGFITPMLTTAVDRAFDSKDWLFELKLDGYRAIAEIRKGKLLLYSRNGISLAHRYPTVAAALRKIKTDLILDGEIVLLNEKGQPDFQKLQNYSRHSDYPIAYYVFDILSLQHEDLKQLPLVERKKILKKLIRKSGPVVFCSHIEEHGKDFFKAVKAEDMEGIIAKKKDSLYKPGIRTREWLKIKNHKSQEAIIAGYTEPSGSRQHFGALLLAQYEKGKLKYIGHAGTGFTEISLSELLKKMKPLRSKQSPFDKPVKANRPVTWLKPELVCEVSYTEITRDGILRHPVFKGLRPEKTGKMVTKESEQELPATQIIKNSKKRL